MLPALPLPNRLGILSSDISKALIFECDFPTAKDDLAMAEAQVRSDCLGNSTLPLGTCMFIRSPTVCNVMLCCRN